MNDLLTTLNPAPAASLTDEEARVAEDVLDSILRSGAAGAGRSWRWAIPVAAVGLVAAGVLGVSALRPPTIAVAPGAGPTPSVAPSSPLPLIGAQDLSGPEAAAAEQACRTALGARGKQDPRDFHRVLAQRDRDQVIVRLASDSSLAECHAWWLANSPGAESWDVTRVHALPTVAELAELGSSGVTSGLAVGPSALHVTGLVGEDVTGIVVDTGTQRIRGTVHGREFLAWTSAADASIPTAVDGGLESMGEYADRFTYEVTLRDGSTITGVKSVR